MQDTIDAPASYWLDYHPESELIGVDGETNFSASEAWHSLHRMSVPCQIDSGPIDIAYLVGGWHVPSILNLDTSSVTNSNYPVFGTELEAFLDGQAVALQPSRVRKTTIKVARHIRGELTFIDLDNF
jgi:hypothetical protein